MTTTAMMPVPKQQYFDSNGAFLNGGKLYTFAAGTMTPKQTFTDSAGATPQANPIILNARGEPASPIFWSGAYDVAVYDSLNNLIYTVSDYKTDPAGIWNISSTIFATLLASGGSALIGFLQAGAGAVLRTVQAKLRDTVSVKDFGAKGDWVPSGAGVGNGTDDSDAIIAAMTSARANRHAVRLPGGKYRVTKPIDVSDVTVIGDGNEQAVLYASTAQFDILTSTGKTFLKDFGIEGGWDGSTAGQLGDAVAVSAASGSYPYNVHIDNLRIQNVKRDGVYIARGGYSSINRCKINACGLHGIELFGAGAGNYVTTVSIGGMTTSSDTPHGYGLMMTDAQNITTDGVISEYTNGIHTAGNDNRAITLHSYYQENTIGGIYLSNSGSGVGITISGSFGGNHTVQELPTWENVRLDGNSNLRECISTANIGRKQDVVSAELVQAAAFTGNFTQCSIVLKPGSWQVFACLQSVPASAPGVGLMTRLAFQLSTDATVGGYAPATNGSFVTCSDMLDFDPAADWAGRLGTNYIFSNNTLAEVTLYMRVYMATTAGIFATKGQITAVKM